VTVKHDNTAVPFGGQQSLTGVARYRRGRPHEFRRNWNILQTDKARQIGDKDRNGKVPEHGNKHNRKIAHGLWPIHDHTVILSYLSLLSPGLLQLSVLRHHGKTDVPRLQSVQNAAARLVTGTRSSYYITQLLRQLHS